MCGGSGGSKGGGGGENTMSSAPKDVQDVAKFIQSRVKTYGAQEADNILAGTSKSTKDALDRYLVSSKNPLSYEAGPQSYRFKEFMRRNKML